MPLFNKLNSVSHGARHGVTIFLIVYVTRCQARCDFNKNPNALHSGLFPNELEFTYLHFVWGDPTGDKYAKTHNCESETAKILKRTFIHICWAVYNNNSDQLEMLEDTIHLLQTQYRRLLLPDVNVDGFLLEKSRRQ